MSHRPRFEIVFAPEVVSHVAAIEAKNTMVTSEE